jgi:hypothetical protein
MADTETTKIEVSSASPHPVAVRLQSLNDWRRAPLHALLARARRRRRLRLALTLPRAPALVGRGSVRAGASGVAPADQPPSPRNQIDALSARRPESIGPTAMWVDLNVRKQVPESAGRRRGSSHARMPRLGRSLALPAPAASAWPCNDRRHSRPGRRETIRLTSL